MKHRDATHKLKKTNTQANNADTKIEPVEDSFKKKYTHTQSHTPLTQARSLTLKYAHIYFSSASIPAKLVCGLCAHFKYRI